MSIRDLNLQYIITDSRSNVIKVPKIDYRFDNEALKMYPLQNIVLFETILETLKDNEQITISKSYITG